MQLVTTLDRFPIMFQGMPQNGSFEPREAIITWEYEPLASQDNSFIESFNISIVSISLTYAYNLDSQDIDSNSEESTILMNRETGWNMEAILDRFEDPLALSVEISNILIFFDEKKVEINVNY